MATAAKRRVPKPPPGIAEAFHKEAERIAAAESIFLGDAFDALRKRKPDLYAQWKRETSYPDLADTLRPDTRESAAAIRGPFEERQKEEFAHFVASAPFTELHSKLSRLMEPPARKRRPSTLSELQGFYSRLLRRGVRLSLAELQEALDRLRQAADVAGRAAAFDARYQRALKAWTAAAGTSQRARWFTDTMLDQQTRPGPKSKREPLPVVATYLALTTGVIRPPAAETAWRGKIYADYEIEPPPIPQCLRQDYLERGLSAPDRWQPTDELRIPLSRRDAIAVVAKYFGWKSPDSCVKFLERQGVAGLPGDRER